MTRPVRRYGKIEVASIAMDDPNLPLALADMGFVPFKVEYHPDSGAFRMLGTSPLFSEKEPGSITPRYDVFIICDEDGDYNHVEVRPQV